MKTDVLKVGHHGSNTSSSESFLKQINPTYAVIMAGKNNSYGLPKQKILDRLAKIGSKIYRTDEKGTIEMISDGNNIEVNEIQRQINIIYQRSHKHITKIMEELNELLEKMDENFSKEN